MNKIIFDKLEEVKSLCKMHRIKSLFIFGSVTTDYFNQDSDIDFLIAFDNALTIEEYTEYYFSLQYKLRALFGREIDLVTENSLSNPYFIKDLERTKQLIYAA